MRLRTCLVLTSRAQYGRSRILLETLRDHPETELSTVVAASALLPKYGDVVGEMARDGFTVDARLTMQVEGGSPAAMAKTTGLGLIEFATAFENLSPDVVIVRGDRFEMLAAAVAAGYLNVRVAHIEGGDVTGSIDESVRHATTKLAHVHFPSNALSRDRILRMGENPAHVHQIGSLDIEFVESLDLPGAGDWQTGAARGLGPELDASRPFLVVLQHPVTSEYGHGRENIEETIAAIEALQLQTVWFWPNVDAGNDEFSKALRVGRETGRLGKVHFYRSLPPASFIRLLHRASCLVGNSSAGIKECSWMGVPVVNIGSRQHGRLRGENVVDVGYEARAIDEAVRSQVAHGRYAASHVYRGDNPSRVLVQALVAGLPSIQKQWVD